MATLELIIDSRRAARGAKQFQGAVGRIAASTKRSERDVRRLDRSMNRLGKTGGGLRRILGGLFAGFSALMIVRQLTRTIANFEDVMATVGAVTNATERDMLSLTETAKLMGATTRFTATQAGEGLLALSRAGFTAKESIEALPSTLNLAISGTLELGEAADLAAITLKQFGLGTEETERAVDVLVNTANSATTTVRDLGEALKKVGPAAAAVGLSLEETNALLAELANRGLRGSEAGTGLRGVIAGLLKPTDDAARALRGMGVSLEEVNPETNNLIDIMERLGQAQLGASEAVRIFGRRNQVAALALSQSSEATRELVKANKQAGGSAADAAKKMEDTLGGSLRSLKSAWESLLLSAGDAGFTKVMRTVIDVTTSVVRVLAGMEKTVDKNRTLAFALAEALKVLATIMAVIVAIKITKSFFEFGEAMTFASSGAGKLTKVLGLVLTALAAIGVAVVAFEFGSFLFDQFTVVQEGAANFITFWKNAWANIKSTFSLVIETFSFLWDNFVSGLLMGLALIVRSIAATVRKVSSTPGFDRLFGQGAASAAAELQGIGATLDFQASQRVSTTLKQRLKGITEARDKEIATNEEVHKIMLDQIDKETEARIGNEKGFFEFFAEDINKAKKIVDEALGSVPDEIKVPKVSVGVEDELGGDAIRKATDELQDMNDLTNESVEVVDELGGAFQSAGEQAANSFTDVLLRIESVRDAARALIQDLSRIAVNQLVTKQLATSFTGALSEAFGGGTNIVDEGNIGGARFFLEEKRGDVFRKSKVVPFAKGGVFTEPFAFPMGGNKVGIGAEAGRPEAIMPLTRGRDGRLGVEASGGGQSVSITQHINIQTQDAKSFKRASRGQLRQDLGRLGRSAISSVRS